MVIGDIIVFSVSGAHSKDYLIESANIEKGKRIRDFYGSEYRFLRKYRGTVYLISPIARNDGNYEGEYMDLMQDGSLRIVWLSENVKHKILEMIRDLLSKTRQTVVFASHLQGYSQRKVCLRLKVFEEKMSCGELQFNTAYVISGDKAWWGGFVRKFIDRKKH